MDLKNIRLGYLPKLDGFATFGANAGTGSWGNLFAVGDNWFTYGLYGFSLSVPVFDGFRKSNQMQKRKIIINQRENQKQRLEKAIDMEIRTARISLENSVARMSTQKENMGLAEEVFEISRAKYQQGLGSNLEVIEAENSYKTSQTNYYNALYEALVAKIDYQKALGRLN
jgi:outer membrane protein TolC